MQPGYRKLMLRSQSKDEHQHFYDEERIMKWMLVTFLSGFLELLI